MADVPIVAYTAYHNHSLSDEAERAGFDEYMIKPVSFGMMRELIDRYFPDRAEKAAGGG
jgi:DNA-binding NtrC family response regulator